MHRLMVAALLLSTSVYAKKALTLQEALADAESALETGRVGDAISTAERLQKSRGISKDDAARPEVVIARCDLILGKYDLTEKLLAKTRNAHPHHLRPAE